ncbi:hypothetical protein ATCC90586_012075 [Pythium insidiosum]|nr:hypothetical protein ATCC90586_012075 [Pythium insidiosum]
MAETLRGRILERENGYSPRLLLKLRLRSGIGSVLCKPQWWRKWRENGGETRAKWLGEIADAVAADALDVLSRCWWVPGLQTAVERKYADFPSHGPDDAKRLYLLKACATIDYNLIWHPEWHDLQRDDIDIDSESADAFVARNAEMESYSMLLWYCGLVGLNEQLLGLPLED